MSTKEFDKLIREKFEEHQFSYDTSNFEKLATRLPSKRPLGRLINFKSITGIAASLLLLAGAYAWYHISNLDDPQPIANITPSQPTISGNQPKTAIPSTSPAINLPPSSRISEKIGLSQPRHSSNSLLASAAQPKQEKKSGSYFKITIPEGEIATCPQELEEAARVAANSSKTTPYNNISYASNGQAGSFKYSKKTLLSVTGGMNYGSLESGYTAGINAKKNLGRKLFLEGDLAIVGNSVSKSTISPETYDALSKNKIETSDINKNGTTITYINFNPSLGYQVHKKVSFSVGADMQRLLDYNDRERTVVFTSAETKLVPDFDMGLTGRTEYTISKRFKAGLLYREGINNFVQGSDEYLNRRYFQVQLKYSVLGK
jgi:hypothetical protein